MSTTDLHGDNAGTECEEELIQGEGRLAHAGPGGQQDELGGVEARGQLVQVVSSEAPLGRAMLGKCEGDEVSIQVAPIRQRFEVLRVH